MSVCPSCGHRNQRGAKFCSECGVALVKARPPINEERKVVTVLFADLVGFTSRAEQMDPEDVRGGHFAAWEQPQLFSEEIRASFRVAAQIARSGAKHS